jgi:hypothetical protein
MTRVKYFIPEDGDDEQHPNLFTLSKDKGLTLKDLRNAFPVPGVYHFRILRSIGTTKVWMDALDDATDIPVDDKCIFAKVTRLRYPDAATMGATPKVGVTQSSAPSSSTQGHSHTQVQAQRHAAVDDTLVDFADFGDAPTMSPTAPAPAAKAAPAAAAPTPVAQPERTVLPTATNVLQSVSSLGSASCESEGDLLGFDAPSTSTRACAPAAAPATNVDLFGLGGLQANVPPSPMGAINGMGMGTPMGGGMVGGPMGAMAGMGGNNNLNRMQQQPPQQQPLQQQSMQFGKKDAFSDLWKK